MQKLLVTGASGFLGWNICKIAQPSWQVYGTIHNNPVAIPGCETVSIDLTNRTDLTSLLKKIKPDAIIHCAAYSQPNACQKDPEGSYKTNVEASIALAKMCADRRIPFVFTSTDLVFDGTNAPYAEEDPVSPVSIYGEQKVEAETGILTRYPEATVCRMPLMFGDPSPVSQSFLQPMITSFQHNEELTLFTDEFRTPVSGCDAAKGLLMMLNSYHGIIHLGGRQAISRYDFGLTLAEYCQFDKSLINPLLQKDITMSAPRPPDVSLDSTRAFNHGYSPSSTIEAFKQLECLEPFRG